MLTMTEEQPREWLSVEEAAQIAHRHPRTVRRWVTEGRLTPRYERVSRRVMVSRAELAHQLELLTQEELDQQT